MAWGIVAAYFVGAAVSVWTTRVARGRDRQFWTGTAFLLILLGLNKQLDLQSVLTSAARLISRHEGWYAERRLIQGVFLLLLALIAVAVVLGLLKWLRRSSTPVKAAALGIALLFAFIVIRASSFHHIDQWLTVDLAGLRSGWWLELTGIAVVAFSALAYRMRVGINRPR